MPEAWFNLADLLEEQRRGPEAVRCLEHAVKADPDYADAIFNLALLLQRLERLEEAAAHWKRYLRLDRTSTWADRAKRTLKLCEMQATFAPAPEANSRNPGLKPINSITGKSRSRA